MVLACLTKGASILTFVLVKLLVKQVKQVNCVLASPSPAGRPCYLRQYSCFCTSTATSKAGKLRTCLPPACRQELVHVVYLSLRLY